MNRYRSYGEGDDQPATVGDAAFLGVDEYSAQENIKPGNVYRAINHDFSSQDAQTRGGFVCLPELGANPFDNEWSRYTAGSDTFTGVAYGNGIFVAVGGNGTIYSSPDAATWTARTSGITNTLNGVTYANGYFIIAASEGSGSKLFLRSTDGITWSLATTAPTLGGWSRPAFARIGSNDTWVSVSSLDGLGKTATSIDDGNTWTVTSVAAFNSSTRDIIYANGKFLVVRDSNVYVSNDAVTWTAVTLPNSPSGLRRAAYGNKTFVVISLYGAVYTSPDALTWIRVRSNDSPNPNEWLAVAFGGDGFVAVGNKKSLSSVTIGAGTLTSLNTTSWFSNPTVIASSGSIPLYYGVTYGNSRFVAVGTSGQIATAISPFVSVYASGIYSDPDEIGQQYIMLVKSDAVGFFASGLSSRTVSLNGNLVTEQSTVVQANNQVYLFRGPDAKPLYWDGDWNTTFIEVPDTSLPPSAGFESIPNSNQATYYQNRLWVKNGKDYVAASDILDPNDEAFVFTDYDVLANEISANTGNSDYVVASFPFGQNSLVVFKNKSVLLFQNVEGSLSDVTMTEVTRQVGLIGINAVTSVGPDLAYVSYGNINLLTLTNTNNSLQHKTLPLSTKIRAIMRRVNWEVGYKISMGYWSNKLYVSLPLDNSPVCNACVVYNFTTENWYGEWNFSSTMNMCIQGWQVIDYLGLQRMHAITEDGRIFVTDEGQNDISGATVAEISTEMITRAYDTDNLNHFQRRIYLDLATNRPKFSAATYTEGANEESIVLTNQTYSRSETWKYNDSTYDLTNANDDFNRAYRKDYSSGALATGDTQGLPPEGLQCGTGFQPEMQQEFRLPLISRRQGRLSWIKVTNTRGFVSVMSLGFETRAGQRANLIQV
jgi:hypothetical protein